MPPGPGMLPTFPSALYTRVETVVLGVVSTAEGSIHTGASTAVPAVIPAVLGIQLCDETKAALQNEALILA